ncbi:hypothetical protein GJ496_003704 [Pomphorhynchus laevis]|nr:hypothetical protein GJ496_003704 [Pomphorhynchus laevis]
MRLRQSLDPAQETTKGEDQKVRTKGEDLLSKKVTIEKLSTPRGDVFSTRCYRKPQSASMYLHSPSAHSQSTKRGLVYSEIRRIIKVSSTQHSRYNALSQLTTDLLDRGYKRRWIDKIMDKFATVSRTELLSAQPKRPIKAACVTSYHLALTSLSRRIV